MPDVFLSYARTDRTRVAPLAHALEARGFDVWWDNELLAGEKWADKIGTQLAAAKAVVVVWSEASVATTGSGWVADEAEEAKTRGILVPVLLDPVMPPMGFRQIQSEDLSGWRGDAGDAAFEKLVRALELLRGAPAAPAPARSFRPAASARSGKRPVWLMPAIGAGVIAVVGAGWLLLQPPAPPEEPPEPAQQGAAQQFGLTDAELRGLPAADLVAAAVERGSAELIEAGAVEKDPLSAGLLCLGRLFGVGFPQDAAAAQSDCENAQALGSPLGAYGQGIALLESDEARALSFFSEAAAQGDARAQLELIGRSGNDDVASRGLAEKCAAQGLLDCRFELAMMQIEGRGGPADPQAAVTALEALVNDFHPAATRELGELFLEGQQVARDPKHAADLLERAAVLNDGEASWRLGQLAEAGDGVEKSVSTARSHYERAVKLGYSDAEADLKRLSE